MFGKRMKDLREKAGMTQKELGGRLGISVPMVSQLERGSRTPSMSVLQGLKAIFNVSIDELVV